MIPLYDRNPIRRVPFVNYAVIASCVAVFVWELSVGASGGARAYEAMIRELGVEPFRLLHWSPRSPGLPQPLTIFSAMFLHADVMHLAGNMLYLWIFGDNVESDLGAVRYLGFYVASGLAAAGAQIALAPGSHLPMIGASGAIAGVLGAYFVLYPQARVRTLLLFGFFARLADVPAWFVLGVWFVLQIGSSLLAGEGPGVAWWAHVGGFAFGASVTLLLRAGRGLAGQ